MEHDGYNILSKLFFDLFGIKLEKWPKEDCKKFLLSADLGLDPRHIIYVIMELQRKYQIHISKQKLLDPDFLCIEQLSDYIGHSKA